jgi:hypothetical protein
MKVKQRTKTLSEALREVKEQKVDAGPIDKRLTSIKAAGQTTKAVGDSATATMEPTPEQLDRVNQFTRRTVQAHEVAVFSTLSCNDLVDRDDEFFTTDTVKEFSSLPEPYGPVGKSYMVGHDYNTLPVGRIFGVGVEDGPEGGTFLTNEVYIPRTDANKAFIENIDFGVNWAVSVGVMLSANNCSLSFCGAQMSRYGFCYEGHDKGAFYVEDGETDSWGYPLPVEAGTAGAEKCLGKMSGAKDFYELSQVFLGAQFYASLEKTPGFEGVIKAASATKVPLLGLSRTEAKALPLPHLDERAAHALKNFGATWDAEGVLNWTDDQKLAWSYDPEDSSVLCLGKSAASDDVGVNKEENDGAAQAEPDAGTHGADDGQPGSVGDLDGGADEGGGASAADGAGDGDRSAEGVGSDGAVGNPVVPDPQDGNNNNQDEEKAVSKAAVLKTLASLKAPATVLSAVEGAAGDSLDAALSPLLKTLGDQDEKIKALTPKAAMGDAFLASKRSEAVDWFVRANQSEAGKGVNTDTFQKLLSAAGENIDVIDSLIEMQKGLAQAKFPDAVRRSSFPADANTATPPSEVSIPDSTDKSVERLHG